MAKFLTSLIIISCYSVSLAVEPTSIATVAQASKPQKQIDLFEKQVAAANKLVAEHLPELKTVLTSLKKSQSREYQKAVGELSRASRRLESYRQQDLVAYDLEIKVLQTQTRADLALAQLQINDGDKSRVKYRDALEAREQAKLARLRHEAKRFHDRITKMESQLNRINKSVENADIKANVQKTFSMVIKRLDQKKETVVRQKRKTTSPKSKAKSEK